MKPVLDDAQDVTVPRASAAFIARVTAARDPLAVARALAETFATTAAARDKAGGTPKAERDQLRASGLLGLTIPRELGGLGATWQETLEIVREIARVDSSLAHVFGFHHLLLATVRLFSRPAQWRPWFEQTAAKQWFWGNALNPLDTRTVVRRHEGWREFSGRKSFCSGAMDSEMLVASGVDTQGGGLLLAAVPTGRSGITVHGDWNNMGQRQTDSGSATFENVRVEEDEMLLDPGPLSTPFSCLRPVLAQLFFANLYLGIAEGAYAQARLYTRKEARPWLRSTAASAAQDPYVLRHYGQMWVDLEGARLLVERAARLFDAAWREGDSLRADARGEVALAVATAKVASTRTGLEVTSRLFEVTGARATHGELGFDRYWRNVRTQTLHDPVDYKLNELGDWALNDVLPTPSFYS